MLKIYKKMEQTFYFEIEKKNPMFDFDLGHFFKVFLT